MNSTQVLTRKHAGHYTYTIKGVTFEIYRQTERDCTWYNEWIIVGNNGYSDPMPTLRDCRLALAYMELNPEEYQIGGN